MNRLSIIIISLLLIFFSNIDALIGQQAIPQVQVSTEKVNISGDIYYVHRVMAKQTLYSISKAYNVSIDSILEQNPAIKNGLKANTVIYISISSVGKEPAKLSVKPVVKPAESVMPVVIPAVKPDVVEEPIAPESQSTKHISKKKSKKYKKHTVKWYETIEDIASSYSVSIEAIIHLNKLEANPVFKKRQKIFIPDIHYQISSISTEEDPNNMPQRQEERQGEMISYSYIKNDSSKLSNSIIEINEALYIYADRTYKISLILPFNANIDTDKASINQMDFYSGVLTAIKDLQSTISPFEYKLNVVDLSNYSSASEMLRSGIIDNSELIIGPITEKDLGVVAQYAKIKRIPIVSPMDIRTEKLLFNNPFLFLFPSLPKFSQINLVKEFIKTDPVDSTKTTIIFEKGKRDNAILEEFNRNFIKYDTLSYGILEGRGIDTIMYHVLDSTHHNKVYIASESEAFVSDVLRNLYLLQSIDTFSINVYGSGRWRNFETLEQEYLHALNTRFSLQYYVDYSDSITISFVKKYWEVFNAEPSPYSFLGYDITTFFLSQLNKYGRVFPAYIHLAREKLLQYDVAFKPISARSGFKNEATRNIIYLEDWEIGSW